MYKLIFIYFGFATTVFSQNSIPGTYIFNSPLKSTSLIIKSDSTFEYPSDITIEGKWRIIKDTLFIESFWEEPSILIKEA